MPHYMLLLYDDPTGWDRLSREEQETAMGEYKAWREKPFVTGGQRLAPDHGRILRSQGGQPRATDGPYSETKEFLGGFYSIEAADYDEAVQRTLDNPHVRHGTVEIRHIFGT